MRLAIHQNGRFLRAISLAKDDARIGRLPSCDLVLEGKDVARYHAFVERAIDGNWTVVSMGQSGTRVNGQEITRARVTIGDELTIGEYRIMFLDETAKPVLAPPKRLPPPPPPPDPEPVLWAATSDELAAEPKTGEVVIPLEILKGGEPIYLLTNRKRSAR